MKLLKNEALIYEKLKHTERRMNDPADSASDNLEMMTMKKVGISYANQQATTSTMHDSDYEKLCIWFLNPKACKTYRIEGIAELLIHKNHIAYILISDAE